MSQIHASAIAIDDQAVLLRGPSGSGKSDLALRLIEQGARLVSDDRVELVRKGGDVIAFPPANIKGMLEVRNLGIIKMQNLDAAPVRLIVDLVGPEELERMPAPSHIKDIEDVEIAHIRLDPFEVSAAAKVSLALAMALGHIERVE